jgi:hypothetical protein
MHKASESAARMLELIKKAIADGEISTFEYEEILSVADADGVLDRQEKQLLNQLQEMLSNGSVKRVK